MKNLSRVRRIAATAALAVLAVSPHWLLAQAPPAGATFRCGDGTYSTAATARGACSRHGGVAQALTQPAAAPAARTPVAAPAAPAPRAPAARAAAAPAGATFRCTDGTFSTAATARGACSRHGGVAEALGTAPTAAPPAAAPAAQPAAPRAPAPRTAAPAAAPAGAPVNATALCKDGTYSMSQHRGGTCSRHGGVDRWLRDVPN
jgi:hypothetical protein